MNPEEMLSSNEIIDNIQLYDATVEIIGFVDGIESPKIVGHNQQSKVFKFFLNNGNGKGIQVVCWNDEISRICDYILPNCINHLDGVQARVPKITSFNNGNAPFELLIRSNSKVNNFGKYEPISNFAEKPITVKFEEIFSTTQRISLDCYKTTNFEEMHDAKLNKKIGCGAITDGHFKLEVHISDFSINEFKMLNINKGSKIQIIGLIQTTASQIPKKKKNREYKYTGNLKLIF
ncbi:hypothetical protein PUN28_009736 [Cardiocondyla obscurior]|uniref:Uncharacterized protein n=1 Tax=Cardiocondyla obscurior TaxID=286306 RepID=A0AAW2FLQ9_9HYME